MYICSPSRPISFPPLTIPILSHLDASRLNGEAVALACPFLTLPIAREAELVLTLPIAREAELVLSLPIAREVERILTLPIAGEAEPLRPLPEASILTALLRTVFQYNSEY